MIVMAKIRKKNFVGQQMYGLLLGGSYDYFDDGGADVTPPVISNVQATLITETTVTITWTTDEASDSRVDYGLTSGYGSNQTDASLVTSHSVQITGLTANTLYHFKVTSKDASNNSSESTDATFTTLQLTNALASDGTAYAIRNTGSFVSTPPKTVCFWARRVGTINASGFFGQRNRGVGNDDGYFMFYNYNADGSTYGWENGGGSYPNLGGFTMALNTWYFIAIVWAGTGANQTTVYRRTEGESSLTSVVGTFPTVPSGGGAAINEEVILTQNYEPATAEANGRICALKVFDSAKSEAELLAESQQYEAQLTTFSFHPMNEDTVAEQVQDTSGNARHFTATGTLTTADGPDIPFA